MKDQKVNQSGQPQEGNTQLSIDNFNTHVSKFYDKPSLIGFLDDALKYLNTSTSKCPEANENRANLAVHFYKMKETLSD